jgi:hypothetical protein
MTERDDQHMSYAELLNSMVEVKTPYASLGEALVGEGFEIVGRKAEKHVTIMVVQADGDKLNHRNNSAVALVLRNDGLSHAVGYDDGTDEAGQFEGKLIGIEIPQYENSISLIFKNLGKIFGNTKITLTTRCSRTISKE